MHGAYSVQFNKKFRLRDLGGLRMDNLNAISNVKEFFINSAYKMQYSKTRDRTIAVTHPDHQSLSGLRYRHISMLVLVARDSFQGDRSLLQRPQWRGVRYKRYDRSHLCPSEMARVKHEAYDTNHQPLLRQPWTRSPDDLTLIQVAAQTRPTTHIMDGWGGSHKWVVRVIVH